MLCLVERHLQRIGLHLAQTFAAARLERFKGQTLEFIETTERIQPLTHLFTYVALTANTHFELSKNRMSHRDISAQISLPATIRAVRIAQASARCNRSICLRRIFDDLLQSRVY